MISAAQLVTDVGNWSHIQAGAAVTLLAVTGRSTLASLKTLATPMLPALKGLPALLPSAGLAAAAGTAAPGAAAAAATAGGGSTVIASLATTLKLPATMLLKRPLAAGAAAGSAGAAAAAMRDTSGTAVAAAAAAGNGGGSSSSSGGGPSRAWSAVGRPLQSIGEGMTHGVRSAVLGIRSLALGNTRALQQLDREPLVVPQEAFAAVGAAAASAPPRRGFWASRGSSAVAVEPPARKWFSFSGRQNQLQLVSQPGSRSSAAVMAAPTALAAGGGGTRQQPEQGQEQPARRRPLAQLGQNVGRHVLWLGSAAARASGQLALLAFGGSRAAQHAAPAAAATGAAMIVGEGASRGVLVHSSSSHQLRQQQQQVSVNGLGHANRSLSLPSLLTASSDAGGSTAAAALAGPQGSTQASPAPVSFSVSSSGRDGSGNSSSGAGGAVHLGGGELLFLWDSSCSGSSSSITCSSYGSKSSGVGRQTLNLPAPRISWGKRATQAMIVRQ